MGTIYIYIYIYIYILISVCVLGEQKEEKGLEGKQK